jgi:uncharacterized cupin superfamily protein
MSVSLVGRHGLPAWNRTRPRSLPVFIPDIRTVPLRHTGGLFSEHSLLDDGDLQVGVWAAPPGTFGGSTGASDEVMFMVDGRASVAHADGEYDLAPGVLWSTPHDWDSRWTVHQEIRKMYVIDNRPGGGGRPEYLSNAYTFELGEATPRPVVVSGDPRERSRDISAHGRLQAGVWDCTPGVFPFRRDGYDEVFCVLDGHATLAFDSGMSFDLRPGAMILTPAGSTGTWTVHEHVRKAYVIINDRG